MAKIVLYGVQTTTVTIANGASLSDAATLGATGGANLVGIITPSGWTTAGMEFQSSADGVTFYDLYSAAGSKVAIAAVAASLWIALDPADFAGVPYLKVRSATSGVAVNQTGGDVLTLVTRQI